MEIINAENIATGEAKSFTLQQWINLKTMGDTTYKFISKTTSPTAAPKTNQAKTAAPKAAAPAPRKCNSCGNK
jgi:hypothetical protein